MEARMMAAMNVVELPALLKRNPPAVDHRGELIEGLGPDFVRLRLPVLASYLSHDLPAGSGRLVLSGPVTMGFAETAMYACVHAFYGAQVLVVTLACNVAFFTIAGAADLTAVARLLKRGRSVAFAEALLYSGTTDQPCAHATATYSTQAPGKR